MEKAEKKLRKDCKKAEDRLLKDWEKAEKIGENGVGHVNCTWIPILVFGILFGLALPFLIDWALFGTATPCHSVKTYEDGSSLQSCQVRN